MIQVGDFIKSDCGYICGTVLRVLEIQYGRKRLPAYEIRVSMPGWARGNTDIIFADNVIKLNP